MRAQQSTAVLLSGPSGTGKSTAASAIGYETGRPLKVINFSRLLSSTSGSPTESGEDSTVQCPSPLSSCLFRSVLLSALLSVYGSLLHFPSLFHPLLCSSVCSWRQYGALLDSAHGGFAVHSTKKLVAKHNHNNFSFYLVAKHSRNNFSFHLLAKHS